MGARLILIEGKVQKSVEGVMHIVAERLIDRTFEMGRLSDGSLDPRAALPAPPALIEPVEGDEIHPRYDKSRIAPTHTIRATSASCRRRGIFIERDCERA